MMITLLRLILQELRAQTMLYRAILDTEQKILAALSVPPVAGFAGTIDPPVKQPA